MVIVVSPLFNNMTRFLKAAEPVLVKAIVSKLAIQAFHQSILGRLAGLNKV